MPRLSDAQRLVLTTAAERADGAVLPLPKALAVHGRARQLMLQGLTRRGLLAASPRPSSKPVSAGSAADRGSALRITPEGRGVIHATEPASRAANARSEERASSEPSLSKRDRAARSRPRTPLGRPGTKQALLVGLLGRSDGATVAEIREVMGWQPHSVRAAITGLRRRGFAVTRARRGDGTLAYRVPAAAIKAGEASA
jgi:DNA-binding MarR family transcriptional regulator